MEILSPVTDPITKMGVAYVFESNFFPQKSLKAGEHPVKKLALGCTFFLGSLIFKNSYPLVVGEFFPRE